jgi:hypothetical protein
MSSWAGKAKAPYIPEVPESTYKYMTDEEYKGLQKQVKEDAKARKIAEVDALDEERIVSTDLKNLRNELIGGPRYDTTGNMLEVKYPGLQTADELDVFIKNLDDNYDKLAKDAKFVAAPLIALRPYRGLTVRMRPIFKDGPFSKGGIKAPVTHAAVVTALRIAGAGINVFTPTEQWKAGFAYFTEPFNGIGSDITNDNDLKRFIFASTLPALRTFQIRMKTLDLRKPIYFDNKILLSDANFVAEKDRFLLIGEAERRTVLSGALLLESAINGTMGYSWDGLISSWDSVASIYGFGQAFKVEGATARDRTSKIMKYNGSLLTMPNREIGKAWMKDSFEKLKEGIKEAKLAWLEVNQYPKTDDDKTQSMLFDPRVITPFNRMIGSSFSSLEAMVNGTGVKSAVVAGQVVDVDLPRFFSDPPENMLSFLPIDFEGGKHELTKYGRSYRNYLAGAPKAWNLPVYRKYFTNIKNDKDVKGAVRILSQAWGGWVIGLPLAAMVL